MSGAGATGVQRSLVERLRAAREHSVEVAPGKRVRVRRPLEWEMRRFRAGVTLELVLEYVVGWEGVTEADLLPPGVGGPSAAEFSAEAAREALGDRHDWFNAVCDALVQQMSQYVQQREAAAKN